PFWSFSSCVLRPPAPTVIYTLSLHDALPIWAVAEFLAQHGQQAHGLHDHRRAAAVVGRAGAGVPRVEVRAEHHHLVLQQRIGAEDRKSTRLNSSHVKISYAVFCLKKKIEKKL